jgi:hypothetical protein
MEPTLELVLVEGIYINNDLVNFLKKENALDEFVKECKTCSYKRVLIVHSIAEAFIWTATESGKYYWREKNKLYLNYIDSL